MCVVPCQVMEVTQLCLEDAGITPKSLPHNTAVYMSMRMGEMILTDCENRNIPNGHILTGGAHTTAANRVSFFYDIRGGSMGVEGACSGAIASIHLGAWSLWNKECDAVIAGGTNLIWSPHYYVSQSHHGYLSAGGEARPFDANADGRVRAEATGVIMLKSLADAIRDGDNIHCVIRGSALSYHGNNCSITLHSPESFKRSMSSVYSRFGIPANKIKYVEANATGNADEDTMEAKAIGELLGQTHNRKNPVRIGSVKGNIGHAESAAGAVGLIKACLMLENREYYPQANFTELSPDVDAKDLNIEVQTKYEKYTEEDNFMLGLNVTSFAGQQCHLVLEEYRSPEKAVAKENLAGWRFGYSDKGRMLPIPLSGKSPKALEDVARQWMAYRNEADAQVVTGWLATRHDHYANRVVVLADSAKDLQAKLAAYVAGEPNDHIVEGKARPDFQKPKVCFVFPGQGQQWWDMGRQLYANEPIYRNVINECDKVWKKCSGYSFLRQDRLFVSSGHENVDHKDADKTVTALIGIVANQVALYEQMVHWGINADMVVGHSLGECSSIYAAGGMTLEDCISNTYIRATSQNKVSGIGSMAAARFTPEEAQEFCSKHEHIWVACLNSTGNVTLGGDTPTVKKLCAEYPTKLKQIRVNSAFHTPYMATVKDEFVSQLTKVYKHRMARDDVTVYSTVTGDVYQGPFDPVYWWENLGHRVNFVDACKSIFRDHGSDVIFLEVGASATLLGNVRQTANFIGVNSRGYVNCGARNKDDRVSALRAIGALHGMGFPVCWKNLTRDAGKYIQLPSYPFQGSYYRLESELFRKKRLWQYKQTYSSENGNVNIQMIPYLSQYQLNGKHIMPAASYIEYLAEMQGEESLVNLKDIRISHTAEIPQRTRNGSYEDTWIVPEVDDTRIALHRKGEKMEHASATFVKKSNVEDLMLDIEKMDDTCFRTICSEEIYKNFSRAGLEYGFQFRVIKEVKVAENKALAYIISHKSRHEVIQAVTLDGAFQVAAAAFSKGAPYTVTELASLKMLIDVMPLEEELVVYCRLSNWQLETFSCDVSIADLDGRVILLAKGVKLDNAAQPSVSVQNCLYTTSWETLADGEDLSSEPWVIVHELFNALFATAIKKQLPNASLMTRKEFIAKQPQTGTNVLYLWSSTGAKNNIEGGDQQLKAVGDLFGDASGINVCVVIPTERDKPNCGASLLQGYLRSLSNTKSSISLQTVTIEKAANDSMAADVLLVLKTAGTNTEFAVRGGKVQKPVICRLPEGNCAVKAKDWVLSNETEPHIFRALMDTKPDVNEVRIRVRAMSRAHQGLLQCAGFVEDTGAGVTSVSIGEAVLGLMCSSMASIVTCKEAYVICKPERLTWVEASAFGFTSAFAYHALRDMVKMKAGDSVYVTDAEKPLGQAVVRVAQALGASVICSGDPATVARMFGVVTIVDQAALSFEKQIMRHTNGAGLDVVISTNGESISQALLDSTRVAGKVAVMGYSTTRVVVDPKFTTCIINARDFINRRVSRLCECTKKAMSLLDSGDLVPTTLPQLPVTSRGAAADQMVSVDIPLDLSPNDLSLPVLKVRDNITCVVIGSLDTMGLELARWLADHGANHLALVSQNGRQKVQEVFALENLKKDPEVHIYEIQADFTNASEVRMIFNTVEQLGAPPVGSIFHAVDSIQDVINENDEAIIRLIKSQIKSAYYLHQEVLDRALELDHFVVLSSIASLLGVPKMAGWAALGSALDDLAALRRQQGLPALSLQLGLVSGVGYMETNPEAARMLEAVGTKLLTIRQCLDVMETLLQMADLPATVAVANQVYCAMLSERLVPLLGHITGV